MNAVIVSDCRICGGREFHSLGAVQLKARAPIVTRRGVGTVSRPAEEERREREGVKGVSQIGGGQVVEGFECEQEGFEGYPVFYR